VASVDVLVAGAGPAGATAAYVLSRAGRSVALADPRLDRAEAPLKPGDALPGAATRVLRAAGLPLPSASGRHRPIGGNASAWGHEELRHRDFLADLDGSGWRLDRRVFEADLVAAAAVAGARLSGRAVRHALPAGAGWCVHFHRGGAIDARWIIDATGRSARIARALGARRTRDEELVAVVGHGRPDPSFHFGRTLVETAPLGWWYAALLPDGGPTYMLHTRRQDAVRLFTCPADWRAALADTRHASTAFPGAVIDARLRGFDASGGWLERVWGAGWAACGDAALSFEPAAAQGLFGALAGGLDVGRAVDRALEDDMAPLQAYGAGLQEVRGVYRRRLLAHYAEEWRWPASPFWRERRAGVPGVR
jgi:flavin-dependent dehydrogenase